MSNDYSLSRRMMSGGGTVTNASDILTQMDDISGRVDDELTSSSSLIVMQPKRTYARRRGTVTSGQRSNVSGKRSIVMNKYDNNISSSSSISGNVNNNDNDHGNEEIASKRKRESLSTIVGGVVVLRDRVSLSEHLQRLLYLLTWSDRNNGGKWMGIRKFIDYYFSLLFQPYLGDAFKMSIIHVTNKRKICSLFSLGTNGSYTILIMLNYPLWDRILSVSVALPNRYFRRSLRSFASVAMSSREAIVTDMFDDSMNRNSRPIIDELGPLVVRHDDDHGITIDTNASMRIPGECRSIWNVDNETSVFAAARRTPAFRISLAALCLLDRLEYSMQVDRDSAMFSHVPTLARFFSNSQTARRLFRTGSSFQ